MPSKSPMQTFPYSFSKVLQARRVGWGDAEGRARASGKAAYPHMTNLAGPCPVYAGSCPITFRPHELRPGSRVYQVSLESLLLSGPRYKDEQEKLHIPESAGYENPARRFHLLQCGYNNIRLLYPSSAMARRCLQPALKSSP